MASPLLNPIVALAAACGAASRRSSLRRRLVLRDTILIVDAEFVVGALGRADLGEEEFAFPFPPRLSRRLLLRLHFDTILLGGVARLHNYLAGRLNVFHLVQNVLYRIHLNIVEFVGRAVKYLDGSRVPVLELGEGLVKGGVLRYLNLHRILLPLLCSHLLLLLLHLAIISRPRRPQRRPPIDILLAERGGLLVQLLLVAAEGAEDVVVGGENLLTILRRPSLQILCRVALYYQIHRLRRLVC